MIRFKGDVYIAPEQIISIEPGDNGYSQINTVSGVCFVSESPQEVARKVLEWKLAMERLRAAMVTELVTDKKEIALSEYQNIKRLSGLEEKRG